MRTFKNFQVFIISTTLLIISYSYSQNATNNIETYSLEFANGISAPVGDLENYADSGINSGFVLNKNFCNNISIGLGTNYSALAVKNEFGTTNEKWSSFSVNIGPQYSIDLNKFQVQFYGRLGVSFINSPAIENYYPKTNVVVLAFEEANTTSLNTRLGINLGIKVCNGLSFYLASEYASNIKNEINYGYRDISKAITESGTIDPDTVSEIDFSNKNLSFSTFNLNFGVRVDLNTNRSTKATDHNSSRSNKTSHTPLNIDNGDADDDNDDDERTTKATDHNSSRSNKTSSAIDKEKDEDEDEDDDKTTKATDHNSSRSNKTSNAINTDKDEDEDEDGDKKTKATDHNSSRSNKTSNAIGKEKDEDEDKDDDKTTKATDHNSSRSNKTSNAINTDKDEDEVQDDDKTTKATDHNSSKSNRTSNVINTDKDEDDDDDDDDKKTKATDHNSSRSNKTSSSTRDDDRN
jgi:hypothetical protein